MLIHYIHPVEPILKRVYRNMKNLQSDTSNFDNQKGVKILTFEKTYTQNVPMCQFSQQSDQQILQDRADGTTSHTFHAIRIASYRSCTKNRLMSYPQILSYKFVQI